MRRISTMTDQEIVDYNLRDGGTAVTLFGDTQAYRVQKARWFIETLLGHLRHPAYIIELGCSSGDISGYFASQHTVVGVDIVPAAVEAARSRWPAMSVIQGQAELIPPQVCDILVLTEFLEHIDDPIALARAWLPKAKFVLIGHPLNDAGNIERGHIWSYTYEDYLAWFKLGGHRMTETHLFTGPFPEMVMGCGVK